MSVTALLSHTQDMAMVVLDQRWDALLDMQLQQDEMLKALFSVENVSFTEQEKQDLFEVQRLNNEILIAAEANKAEIVGKLRNMHQGKSKTDAYQAL